MQCDDVSSLPPAAACAWFRPGDARQDLYTIPLEALLVAAVSSVPPPKSPRWPFENETTNKERLPTRHSKTFVSGVAVGTLVPVTWVLLNEKTDFPVWTHLRGVIHTHLWTEFFTSSAKNYFGRERPFYDTVIRNGEQREDDKRSFFSGHSSHSFAFATYTSQLILDNFDNRPLAWSFVSAINGAAGWIAAARAVDGQHHWSDVLTGSVVGAAVGYGMYEQVREVAGHPVSARVSPISVSFQIGL